MNDADLLDRLQLIRSENVGPITYRRLIERYGTAAAALRALPQLAAKGGAKRPLRLAERGKTEDEYKALQKAKVQILALGAPDYPALLAAIDDAPPLLMLKGNASLLHKPCLAIVGARNASLNARKFAGQLARDLGQAGYSIVSGLARGIDGAAHEASLTTGTIGVVAGGVDIIYPEENRGLYERMYKTGVVVSEVPLGAAPTSRDFPRRNRIIAGLSRATIVVEAALQSGSLITARMATDYGRDVFAVPGSPLDPRAGGTNSLIRDGATLVTSAADILQELQAQPRLNTPAAPPLDAPDSPPDEAALDQARPYILELLSPVPTQLDELLREAVTARGIATPLVLTVLLELELAGRLARHPGGRVALLVEQDQLYG